MFSCQSCLFGGFLVHRPRGRIQVLPAHLALSRHGFLCLLTHQLYSYCLQGCFAYYIKQNLFRWIGVFLRITKKESEWFSIETSPTWYAILKYARTMINKLRRLDGRGHFKALFTSFSRRALHKDIGTCSNFKAKYWSFTLLYHDSLWPKNVMLESLMQI